MGHVNETDYNNAYKVYKTLGEDYKHLVYWTDSWDYYEKIVKDHFPAEWKVGHVHKDGSHGAAVYIDVKLKRLDDAFDLRKAYE